MFEWLHANDIHPCGAGVGFFVHVVGLMLACRMIFDRTDSE